MNFRLFSLILLLLCQCFSARAQETVADIDGNVYQTAVIGNQVWMLENLKTTTLNDGEPITVFTSGPNDDTWFFEGVNSPFFTWAFTGDLNNLYDFDLPFDFYGALYSHGTITSGKLSPAGWRIPSQQDFLELENFIANDGHADNPMAALRGVGDWFPSLPANDEYGFRALPAGYAITTGGATGASAIATWATSDSFEGPFNTMRKTVSILDGAEFLLDDLDARFGNSVRCVKNVPKILLGDVNGDGSIDLLDVGPFVRLLANGNFSAAADINQDGNADLLDVQPFVDLLAGN